MQNGFTFAEMFEIGAVVIVILQRLISCSLKMCRVSQTVNKYCLQNQITNNFTKLQREASKSLFVTQQSTGNLHLGLHSSDLTQYSQHTNLEIDPGQV